MIVLIDNYDSFTFNLVHYLGGLGAAVVGPSQRQDHGRRRDRRRSRTRSCCHRAPVRRTRPASASTSSTKASATGFPIFGVCLGHQAIGQAFGGEVVRAPVAGAWQALRGEAPAARACSAASTSPFQATRYHSLLVERATLPGTISKWPWPRPRTTGWSWALSHKRLPVHGVQFHPESIASEHGHLILKNFLDLAAVWNASHGRRVARAVQVAAARMLRSEEMGTRR